MIIILDDTGTISKITVDSGLSIWKEQCDFLGEEVIFLGYNLYKNGLLPLLKKTGAIKAPPGT